MSKGIHTRERIIERSADLFNSRGYDGCSMHDIMKATGLKKGGIYNHFKNKDEIALEAFDYNLHKMISRFRIRLDKDKTAKEKLLSVIEVMGSLANDDILFGGCPIFNTAIKSAPTHPGLRARAKSAMNMLVTYVEIKIKEGINNKEFNPDLNPNKLANMMIMTLEGAVVMSRIYDNSQPANTAISYIKDYLNDKVYRH